MIAEGAILQSALKPNQIIYVDVFNIDLYSKDIIPPTVKEAVADIC